MSAIITLKNNLPLIALPIAGAKTTTVLLLVATGSKYETRAQSGLSHFLEHMFFKGTTRRPSALILSSELDGLGAEYNAFTSKEYTGYWIKTAANQAGRALEIVGDMLTAPLLAEEEINREKGVIIEELNMYLDNPRWHIEDVWEELLYGDTPAGWPTIGTKDNIKSWQRTDFLRYYRSQYGLASSLLVVAGQLPDNLNDLAEIAFADLAGNDWQNKTPTRETQSEPGLKLFAKATDQAHLALGARAYAFGHADEFALKILTAVLGGSMSSRLFSNLRERHGLAYYVNTSLESYTDSGYLVSNAGVPLNELPRAIGIIRDEYRRLIQEAVPTDELNKVKDMMAGKLAMHLEASDDLAQWSGRQAILLKQQQRPLAEILTPEQTVERLRAVNASDIQRVAQNIFRDERLNLALIAPEQNTMPLGELLRLS